MASPDLLRALGLATEGTGRPMSLHWTDVSRWRRQQWVVALTTLLLLTLTPLIWIQWRQYQMLEDLAVNQVDALMWQAYQLERESDRLKLSLQATQSPTEPTDAWKLSERYEVFLSRIELLARIPRADLLTASPEYRSAMATVNGFVAYAAPIFRQPQRLIHDAALRSQMVAELSAMDAPLSELTRQANRAVAQFVDGRNHQLRQQGWLVVALATGQIAIMLLFVGLLLRHARRQRLQVAELQALSQALKTARDEAETANQGKSVFLANMSHEIRTPFHGLLGMLNLLDDASLTTQQRDYMQTAKDSAMHLLGVLNDILDVSTLESGTMKLSLAPVHLPSVVQEVDGLMQVAAHDKGLTLTVSAAADLPEWVSADATRLRQIMFNLISNAIKFTETGGVKADLTRVPGHPSALRFTVRDTGIGMDTDARKALFTRFYQADSSLRRRTGGTGLGLEISRNLARMMGGDIAVQSTPGMGSTFTVTLNLTPSAPPPVFETPGNDLGLSRKLRILVAEDHPINLKYMKILLQKMGHEACFCENGQEALEHLQQQAFDLVLLDYHMPVLDGLATTEAIRALDGPLANIKIILVTADVVNDTRKRAHDVGVNEFVSKPLQVEELQKAIARCGLGDVDGQPGEASIAAPAAEAPERLFVDAEPPVNTLLDSASFAEMRQMMPTESLDELLKTVFDGPDGTAHVLAQCIVDGDRAAIGYNAHKLKGAAMLMGFRSMVATSTRIEYLAMQTDDVIGHELSQQVLHDAALTKAAIARYSEAVPA
jgi:signal transduction histidine kinase/DNA-binding NarL/FixJ family response regulator